MSARRSVAARVGVLAVLFQAILFGWHHHDLTFRGRLPWPGVEKPAAAPHAVDDEDGCEICQVLHHLTAAPIEFPAVTPPCTLAAVIGRREPPLIRGATTAAFQARAPPSSDAATG